MFLSRDVSFQAEDTVDRGSVSVPWSHLPTIKHVLTPALQPASQPKGALESPSTHTPQTWLQLHRPMSSGEPAAGGNCRGEGHRR